MYDLFANHPDGLQTLSLTEEGFSTLCGAQCFYIGDFPGRYSPAIVATSSEVLSMLSFQPRTVPSHHRCGVKRFREVVPAVVHIRKGGSVLGDSRGNSSCRCLRPCVPQERLCSGRNKKENITESLVSAKKERRAKKIYSRSLRDVQGCEDDSCRFRRSPCRLTF